MGKSLSLSLARLLTMVALLCLPFVANADELTVNDGTSTTEYAPLYGFYGDTNGQESQMLYLATDLEDFAGGTINSLSFYSTTSSTPNWGTAVYSVKLMETTDATLPTSGLADVTSATEVYNGTLTLSSSKMIVTFATPFVYNGGNLLVDFTVATKGGYAHTSWYGVSSSGLAKYKTSATSITGCSVSPKTTFTYTPAPEACARPVAVWTSDVLNTSAKATWNAADGVSNYQYLLLGANDTINWTLAQSATDTTVMLTGLTANTAYTFVVRSDCGSEQSRARQTSFRTACDIVSTFPWIETFESATSGVTFADPCWTNEHVDGPGSYRFEIATYPTSGNATNLLKLPDMNKTTHTLLTSPVFDIPAANAYELKVEVYRWASVGTTQKEAEGLTFIIGNDTLGHVSRYYDVADGTRVPAETAVGWYTYTFTIPQAGVQTLKILGTSLYGSASYADNLQIREIPTCFPSKDFHFASSTTSSATFAWTPVSGVSEWQIQYRIPHTATAYTTVAASEPSLTVTGLTSGTAYSGSYIIHGLCGGVLSPDSVAGAFTFNTVCEQLVGDTVRFDAELADLTPCYGNYVSKGTYTYKWGLNSGVKHGGSKSFCVSGCSYANSAAVLALPEFSLNDNSQLNFWAKVSEANAADSMIVRLALGTDTIELARLKALAADWTEYRIDLAGHRGDNARLLFEGFNYKSIYLDDIVIAPKPACQPIQSLAHSGTFVYNAEEDKFSTTFTWAAGADEAEWRFVAVDDTVGDMADENVDAMTFSLSELEPNTKYSVLASVYAVCDEGVEANAVSQKFVFTTPCSYVSFPLVEDFDDLTVAYSIPDCWDNSEGTTTTVSYKWGMATTGVSSTKCVGFNSYNNSNGNTNFLKSPKTIATEDVRIKFKWCNPTGGDLSAYYTIDGGEMVLLKSGMKSSGSSTWTAETFDIANTANHVIQVIFKGTSNYGNDNYLVRIDDVEITGQPTCFAVTNFHLDSLSTDYARFAWTGHGETQWNVQVKKGSTVVASTTVDAPCFAIDTLVAASSYSYKILVKAVCDGIEADDFLPEQTVTFKTPCETVSTFPWSENFESMTASALAPCWDNSASSSVTAAGTSSYIVWGVYSYSSNKMLYMKNFSVQTGTALVTSPTFALPAETDYILTFDYSNRASCGAMKLNISTDGGVHFTELGSYGSTGSDDYTTPGTFTSVEVSLAAYAGRTIVLQFAANADYRKGAIYLDNVAISEAPSCLKPVAIHPVDTLSTTSSVAFAWSGNAPQYEVKVNGTVQVVNDTVCQLTGLAAARVYTDTIYVRGICQEGDTSDWSDRAILSMTTACEAKTQFPIVYGFETSEGFKTYSSYQTTNTMPVCWANDTVYNRPGGLYGTRLWAASTSSKYNGSAALCLPDKGKSDSVATKTLLRFPAMTLDAEKEYELAFWLNRDYSDTTYYEGFRIFVSHKNVLDESAVELGLATHMYKLSTAITPKVNASGWYKSIVSIPMSGEVYLYFQGESYYKSATYVDDVVIREKAVCGAAADIHIVDSAKTANSVTVAWSGVADQGYNVAFFGKDTIYKTVTDTFCVLGNLQPSKDYIYSVQVVSQCVAGAAVDTVIAKNLHFETECVKIASLPFSDNFESDLAGYAYGMPNCWNKIAPANNSYPYVYESSSTASDGKNSLYFYGGGATSKLYAVLPEFDESVDLTGARIKFDYKSTTSTSSYYYGQLVVGAMSDPANAATFVALDTLAQKASYTEYELYLDNVPDSCHYLAVAYLPIGTNTISNYGSAYVDRLSVSEQPSCLPGSKLHAIDSLATTTSVTFAWTPYSAENLNARIVVKNGNTVLANATVADTAYTLTGLSSSWSASLSVAVYTICDAIESADSVGGTFAVHTLCDPIATLPWTEGFEGANLTCWTVPSGVEVSTSYVKTGSKDLRFATISDVVAVLPEFEAPLSSLVLDFSWRCEGTNYTYMGYLEAGYVTDPSDDATFVALHQDPTHKYTYTDVEVYFPDTVPAGARMAFRYYGASYASYYLFVDDITVKMAPTCRKPTGLVMAAEVADTAVISWSGNAAEYALRLTNNDTVLLADTVLSQSSFVVRNLSARTTYNLKAAVVALCSAEDHSDTLKAAFSFSTPCLAIDLTGTAPLDTVLHYGFESTDEEAFTTSTWTVAAHPCLTNEAVTSTYKWSVSSSYAHSGSQSLVMYYENKAMFALPQMTFDAADAYELSFYARAREEYYYDDDYWAPSRAQQATESLSYAKDSIVVYLNSTPSLTGATRLGSTGLLKDSYTRYEFVIPTAGTQYVILVGSNYSTYYYYDAYLYMDDVVIRRLSSCHKVTDIVKTAVTENSATFGWTAGGSEAAWLVKVYEGANRIDSVVVNSPAYVMNDLVANHPYTRTLVVSSSCDEGELSEAVSETFTFRTTLAADSAQSLAAGATFDVDFADQNEVSKWAMLGDDETNHFMIGSIAQDTTALFVTNDNATWYYNTGSASAAIAYRVIEIPSIADAAGDTIQIEYTWRSNGESVFDFGRAFFAPSSHSLSVAKHVAKIDNDTIAPGKSNFVATAPAGTEDIAGGLLVLSDHWTKDTAKVVVTEPGQYRLIFAWGNDGSQGVQKPLAVFGISVTHKVAAVDPTGLEQIATEADKPIKFIRNNQVYILFRGVIYNALGQQVTLE